MNSSVWMSISGELWDGHKYIFGDVHDFITFSILETTGGQVLLLDLRDCAWKRDAVMANAISKRRKPQNLTAFLSGRGHVQYKDLVTRQFQEALNTLL
jgi:hypothetical protein